MLAQISLEFITFITFLLALLSLVIYQRYILAIQTEEFKAWQDAQKTVDEIAAEINLAVKIGDGYSHTFYVEKNLYGISNFTVEVDNYTVSLMWKDGTVYSQIIIKNITGQIKPGYNLIKNINGWVYVE